MPWYGAPEGSASSSGVTSIDVTADSPIVVAGSPITDTGTISLSLPTYSRKAQYSAPVEPWNPAQAKGIIFYLNTYNGNMLWQDDTTVAGCFSPAVPNIAGQNRVGMTWCPINGNGITSNSLTARPYLKWDATRNSFLAFSGSQNLNVDNSRSQFAFFYSSGVQAINNLSSGVWTMGAKFRVSATGARAGIFDCNGRTGGKTGMGFVFEGSAGANCVSFQIGNGVNSLTITNPVSSNAAYTDGVSWNYVIASGNGTTAYVNLNGTVTSAAITQNNYVGLSSSGIPNLTFDNIRIGSYVTDANYLTGDIADCFIANTNWGNQPVDVANWISHDPPFGYYNTNELKYNGRMSSNGIFDMVGLSGAATEWLEPRQVQGLYDFTDCTDPTSMWTTSTGNIPVVVHGPTQVANSGDKVGFIANKAAYNGVNPSGLMRMTSSPSGSTMLPTYHTNVINGKGAVYFSGSSPTVIPSTGENNLFFKAWNQTPKTWFVAFKHLPLVNGVSNIGGSHLISTGASNGTYIAVCASGYIQDRKYTTVQHSSNGAITSPVSGVLDSAFNIVETVQHGGIAAHLLNGTWIYSGPSNASGSTLSLGEFQPTSMGRPAITGWDMNGYIAYKICYNGALDAETRRRVRGWIADQLGILSYVNTAY